MKITWIVIVVSAFSTTACEKNATIIAPVPAKSLAYFSANIPEARKVTDDCKRMASNELSTMSPQKMEEWRQTTVGINCKNAMQATAVANWNAYQQSMTDSAMRLSAPPPKRATHR